MDCSLSLLDRCLPPLLGVIVGAVISYSIAMRNTRNERKNIGYAIYQEIYMQNKLLEKMICKINKVLGRNENSLNCEIVDDNHVFVDVLQLPLYSEKDLYFVFRKEISSFSKDLSNSIVRLHTYIKNAEEERIKILKRSGNTEEIYTPLLRKAMQAQDELKRTKQLLEKVFRFSEQDVAK